nr:nuclear pore complex protein DDB_G0274915-like isoform X2 [Penaeus vannamei]
MYTGCQMVREPGGAAPSKAVLIQMKEAADKRRELERQHAEALAQLRERQSAISDTSRYNDKDRKASVEVIEALQSKIRELEKKAEAQNLRHEELLLEMQSLKKAQGSPKNSWSRSGSLSADLQSPDSGDVTPDSSQILSNGSTARSTPVPPSGMGMSLPHGLDVFGLVDLPDSLLVHQPPLSTSPLAGQSGLTSLNSLSSSGVYTTNTSSSLVASGVGGGGGGVGVGSGLGGFPNASPLTGSANLENAATEIDRIMAKIEQDNKILAELEKSRSTIGLSTTSTGVTSLKTSDLITSLGLASRTMAGITPSSFAMAGTGMTSLTGAVTTTVSAMDLSNPIVNPLGNNPLGSNPLGNNPLGLMDPTLASHMGGANPSLGLTSLGGLTGTNLLGGTSLPGVSLHSTNPLSVTNPASLSAGLTGVGVVGTGVGMAGGGISNPVFTSVNPLPTIITTSYDKDDKNLVNGNIPGVLMPQYETDNRVLDVLEIPGKGRCHVYIARYSYDPFQHSPNENPEAELAVNAGDYVLVWGAMDEDGFFDGELLDGRRGLVPSNFVEKLVGEDLIEFHQSVVMGLRDGDESMSTSVPQDLDFISQDESQLIELAANQTRHNAYTSYIDLEDIIEEEEETLGEHERRLLVQGKLLSRPESKSKRNT